MKRYTEMEQQELVNEYTGSGQSLAAFASARGISVVTLRAWTRKFAAEGLAVLNAALGFGSAHRLELPTAFARCNRSGNGGEAHPASGAQSSGSSSCAATGGGEFRCSPSLSDFSPAPQWCDLTLADPPSPSALSVSQPHCPGPSQPLATMKQGGFRLSFGALQLEVVPGFDKAELEVLMRAMSCALNTLSRGGRAC
jgi:hypothetical protein